MKKLYAVIMAALLLCGCTQNGNAVTETTVSESVAVEAVTEEAVTSSTTVEIAFDETDEILVKGQVFAEAYAEMSWNYLHGAAWNDYTNIKYFDFNDKSEPNYFEYEGIPFYKLLITDLSYNDLITHIKSFFTDEIYEKEMHFIGSFIIGIDNCIYVNGNEPTYIFPRRNERACIISYIKNDDSTITYNCYAKSTEAGDEDLYFSFTLNSEGKLCEEIIDSEMRLFSTVYY